MHFRKQYIPISVVVFSLFFSGCVYTEQKVSSFVPHISISSSTTTTPAVVFPFQGNVTTSLFIAHAGGTVLSDDVNGTGTNSKEALDDSYASGFRFVEMDFSLTRDGTLFLFHDGSERYIGLDTLIGETDYDEFMGRRFQGKYTLMDLTDLLKYLLEHDNLYIITDFKSDFYSSVNTLLSHDIFRQHPELKQRFIIQIYEPEQLNQVEQGGFEHIIFTLYRTPLTDDEVLAFIQEHVSIDAVAMWWNDRYTDAFAKAIMQEGCFVYVHTINERSVIDQFFQKSVGVYTDYIDVNTYAL
ncbi:MAG: hypothetical protein GW939_01335 [Candidatus Magasanikbacteria bacterium]|nr:hypothetical protein [Candidatus Magasanikbacteria bacterium]NCS72222.1 hypothetical protein [Candidatus Magasanikbacteria bacterium]